MLLPDRTGPDRGAAGRGGGRRPPWPEGGSPTKDGGLAISKSPSRVPTVDGGHQAIAYQERKWRAAAARPKWRAPRAAAAVAAGAPRTREIARVGFFDRSKERTGRKGWDMIHDMGGSHRPAVIELATGDTGARAFLRARPELVRHVECADTGSPDDVDTAADLARVRGVATVRSEEKS